MFLCLLPHFNQPVAWSYNQPSFASCIVPHLFNLADYQCFLRSLLVAAGSLIIEDAG